MFPGPLARLHPLPGGVRPSNPDQREPAERQPLPRHRPRRRRHRHRVLLVLPAEEVGEDHELVRRLLAAQRSHHPGRGEEDAGGRASGFNALKTFFLRY